MWNGTNIVKNEIVLIELCLWLICIKIVESGFSISPLKFSFAQFEKKNPQNTFFGAKNKVSNVFISFLLIEKKGVASILSLVIWT